MALLTSQPCVTPKYGSWPKSSEDGVAIYYPFSRGILSATVLTDQLWIAATKEDIREHFKDAAGKIQDIKLIDGFGFIEYEDPMDARDVVPSK